MGDNLGRPGPSVHRQLHVEFGSGPSVVSNVPNLSREFLVIERSARVVKFVKAELTEGPGNRCVARVELAPDAGGVSVGTVEGGCSEIDGLRSVAQATANALVKITTTGEDGLDVKGLEISQTFGKRILMLTVSAYYYRERRDLMGLCAMDEMEGTRAAALAVLNATNRFLGVG